MDDDLVRLESAVSATAGGNLTYERWPHDYIVALGFAGLRNPLGFAVVRYLSDSPSSVNAWNVILVLANEMIKRGVSSESIKDKAFDAFDYWRDIRCPSCGGRGVAHNATTCSACGGSGNRPAPQSPDWLGIGIQCLVEAEHWMDGQLQAKLRRGE